MSELDRDKPFGTVFGGYTEARYEQDGKLFDGAGKELKRGTSGETTGPAIKAEPEPESKPAPKPAAKKPAAKKAPAKDQ